MDKKKKKSSKRVYLYITLIVLTMFVLSVRNNVISLAGVVDYEWEQIENVTENRYKLLNSLMLTLEKNSLKNQGFSIKFQEVYRNFLDVDDIEARIEFANQLEMMIDSLPSYIKEAGKNRDRNVDRLLYELTYSKDILFIHHGRYNQNVKLYNDTLSKAPSKWFTSLFKFQNKIYFNFSNKGDEV